MFRPFPPDVIVLDREELIHARVVRGGRLPTIASARRYRVPPTVFSLGGVTPSVADEEALAEVVRRARLESGRIDRASLLLPDTWLRMSILEVSNVAEKTEAADEIVRWTLRRNMPAISDKLRLAYTPLSRNGTGSKLLVVAAAESTMHSLESAFSAAGVSLGSIESTGLNLWNAIGPKTAAAGDRMFFYLRPDEFTIALFRGEIPMFIRSRPTTGDRSLLQEIRLSASYVRSNIQANGIAASLVAGRLEPAIRDSIAELFGAPIHEFRLREIANVSAAIEESAGEAELAACTGVSA
jgi:Tfp pilus assembly PilM family ATPase